MTCCLEHERRKKVGINNLALRAHPSLWLQNFVRAAYLAVHIWPFLPTNTLYPPWGQLLLRHKNQAGFLQYSGCDKWILSQCKKWCTNRKKCTFKIVFFLYQVFEDCIRGLQKDGERKFLLKGTTQSHESGVWLYLILPVPFSILSWKKHEKIRKIKEGADIWRIFVNKPPFN